MAEHDVVLIELWRQWQGVRDAFARNVEADKGLPPETPEIARLAGALDAGIEALIDHEDALLEAIMAIPAQILEGLAVKARVLAIEHECDGYDEASILSALEDAWYPKKAAFSLAADILRLAKEG